MLNISDFRIENGVLEMYCGPGGDVVIPEGVTSIGDGAFIYYTNLTSVVISEGVTSIGNEAFRGCSSLSKIVIPKTVTTIGSLAFYKCNELKEFIIHDGVTHIGESAFEECYNLKEIVIPESVVSIGEGAFEDCVRVIMTGTKKAYKPVPDTSAQVSEFDCGKEQDAEAKTVWNLVWTTNIYPCNTKEWTLSPVTTSFLFADCEKAKAEMINVIKAYAGSDNGLFDGRFGIQGMKEFVAEYINENYENVDGQFSPLAHKIQAAKALSEAICEFIGSGFEKVPEGDFELSDDGSCFKISPFEITAKCRHESKTVVFSTNLNDRDPLWYNFEAYISNPYKLAKPHVFFKLWMVNMETDFKGNIDLSRMIP